MTFLENRRLPSSGSESGGKALLKECLHPDSMLRAETYAESFQKARPFRHVVIDGFLTDEFCDGICAEFPEFDPSHAIDENRKVGGKAVREKVPGLGPSFATLDELVSGSDFLALIGQITGIDDLHYDPHYFGGGTHENRHGQDLDPHIDFNYHPITRQHRRLNLIIYLNPEWAEEWGGALQLHKDPHLDRAQDEVVTISPLKNRCVIFETTEHSWHGFERIDLPPDRQHLSRKSFALYYYTDTRPVDETADEHSTVYVERPLPDRFQAGLTLGEADVLEIRRLVQRRDQHLTRLYDSIQKLHEQLNQARYASGDTGKLSSEDIPVDVQSAARMIKILRHRVDELENSTSWKVTAPLRAFKRLISRD